ncbi:MAG: hypothetical protein LVR00_06810 [Rhabdochlamydiaceae bacterium]|jgi:hypothetical protein
MLRPINQKRNGSTRLFRIRSQDKENGKLLANKVFSIIQEEHLDLQSAAQKLQDENPLQGNRL